uniref:Uncharacterized protein n=1 Tax=Tetradesmus obliquus TaxID=3088 RepID=A0A383WM85_TETOB|eukprot:jgi/Sobl393_1/11304/SZX78332.1
MAFIPQVPADKPSMLVSLFARLNDRQAATMSRLLNSLSAGHQHVGLVINWGVDFRACPPPLCHLLPRLPWPQVPADKLGMLVDLFASLSDRQAATMSRLLNSLSAGQMVLALQLLEKFNFGVDNIQSSIPAASSRGSSFNIGPFVRVTVGGSSARGVGVGGLRLGLLG